MVNVVPRASYHEQGEQFGDRFMVVDTTVPVAPGNGMGSVLGLEAGDRYPPLSDLFTALETIITKVVVIGLPGPAEPDPLNPNVGGEATRSFLEILDRKGLPFGPGPGVLRPYLILVSPFQTLPNPQDINIRVPDGRFTARSSSPTAVFNVHYRVIRRTGKTRFNGL